MRMQQPITILGGMEPQASAHLYMLLIEKSRMHNRSEPEIFPHIILRSLAVPDFINDRTREKEARKILISAARSASNDKSKLICIACNTAHLLKDAVVENSNTPFISMIDAVCELTKGQGHKTVGLLASPTTIQSGLYKQALKAHQIACIEPNESQQRQLETIIRNVITGRSTGSDQQELIKVAQSLIVNGASALILGCTELPLVFSKEVLDIVVIDSLDALADRLIQKYYE